MKADDLTELGYISGFFGVKGLVKIYSYTRPRVGISQYRDFYSVADEADETTNVELQQIVFEEIKSSGKHIVGKLQGIDSRDAASPYVGKRLFVKRRDLPALDGEYYWHELIGLQVVNKQQQLLGSIVEMLETGANDVMVIRDDGGEEVLIPYVASHFVVSVDTEKGEMLVDWELDSSEM